MYGESSNWIRVNKEDPTIIDITSFNVVDVKGYIPAMAMNKLVIGESLSSIKDIYESCME